MTIQVPSLSMKKSLAEAVAFYHKNLEGDADLYLKNRSISKEAQDYFQLGCVKDPLPGHERMQGRLVIPYITQTGPVQIRFRAIPDDGIPGNPESSPKYMSEIDAKTTLFNVRSLSRQENFGVICEGEIDTITAAMSGLIAVGVPGANAWNPLFARALRYRKWFILADNDDKGAGIEFAEKVKSSMYGSKIILMPPGYDVNSFVIENGIDALREKVGV